MYFKYYKITFYKITTNIIRGISQSNCTNNNNTYSFSYVIHQMYYLVSSYIALLMIYN